MRFCISCLNFLFLLSSLSAASIPFHPNQRLISSAPQLHRIIPNANKQPALKRWTPSATPGDNNTTSHALRTAHRRYAQKGNQAIFFHRQRTNSQERR